MTDEYPARPYADMFWAAEQFVAFIQDCAEKTMICGSLRRKKSEVHDVDIVAIPKYYTKIDVDQWFGLRSEKRISALHERVNAIIEKGLATKRLKKDGTSMIGSDVAMLMFQNAPLDIYYAEPETWWGLVQMRTGSAGFNTFLASRALKLGLKYHADGKGITKDGVRIDDGSGEEAIFKALNLEYVPPEKRN